MPVEITPFPVSAQATAVRQPPIRCEPGALAPDRTLVIGYEQQQARPRLTFTLYDGETLRREFPPYFLARDLGGFVAQLYRRLTHFADTAGRSDDERAREAGRQAKQMGRRLWADVLPAELQALYLAERAAWQEGSLLLASDEPHIPWELVWPYWAGMTEAEDMPWCASMNMARWLRRGHNGAGHPGPTARLRWQGFACLAPTDSRLTFAQEECAFLAAFAAERGLADRSPVPPTLDAILDLLTGGDYDWLHAATHGDFGGDGGASAGDPEPGQESVIQLQGRAWLTPDDLLDPQIEAHMGAARPGFVLNTCHGGRLGWGLTGVGGWADRLIGAGAGLFLAPQWAVDDQAALAFARTLYAQLVGGEAVAAAVRAARRQARRVGDPSWLAYSLYAHPHAQIVAPLQV